MKKTKLTAILMACVMMVSMLGACGGEEEKKEAKPSEKTEQPVEEKKEEAEGDAVTDETWEIYIENLRIAGETMIAVGDSNVPDSEITQELMDQTETISSFTEKKREDYTEDEAIDDANMMADYVDVLNALIDKYGMKEEAAEEAPAESEGVTQEEFTALQENFAGLVEAYNAVKELYEMEEVKADQRIEDLMNEAADIINAMGEVEGSTLTKESLADMNNAIDSMLTGLSNIIDQIQPK